MTNAHDETKFVGVKVPIALNEKLEKLARAEGNKVSAVVRRLLTVAIAREEQNAPKVA